jgi:hypothetical protein
MADIIINNIDKIAGSILLVFFVGYSVWRRRQKKRAAQASAVFRSKVLDELEGLYPIPQSLKQDVFNKFRESIPGIESAAAEFRNFVPSRNKNSFDGALKNYINHCNKITWEDCVTFKILPGRRKPDDIGPKEIFRQNVNAILSFAKKQSTSSVSNTGHRVSDISHV